MLVKICGITTVEAALTAVEAGADFIGFVFAESKRQISPLQAAEIASALPSTVKLTGVFVNETINSILEIADVVGLDTIQLHGDEPPEMIEQLPFEVVKAIPAKQDQLKELSRYSLADYYLVDSPFGKARGGNGTTFDWDKLNNLSSDRSKLLLAGGLHAGNVANAIQQVNPAGVDVSSGVETNGDKDLVKIEQFIKQAKSTAERMNSFDNIYHA